ncbi:MAG: hypothetical protein OIN87_12710 [Candidatus Methanoperedens sp.]|nr:hypothetical protein [Candidatus Methanoperedens sp.]
MSVNAKSYEVPEQADWIDQGIVIGSGSNGAWDIRLGGMTSPSTVVKKNGTFFLYYIGADGNRSTDKGPRHRALGVATSTDGINFIKYARNPILNYLPHKNEEEGIFSAGATLDEQGNIVLYYAALDAGSTVSESVNSDVRLAVSSNGFDFKDLGKVISHSDKKVWGYGDELFPIGAFNANGNYSVYYIAKGFNGIQWDLGIASGHGMKNLTITGPLLLSGSDVIGGGDPVYIENETIALFIVRGRNPNFVEVRTASINKTNNLSEPIVRYDNITTHNTIFLDKEINTWFMYYYDPDKNSINVKTARSDYSEYDINRNGKIDLSDLISLIKKYLHF